MIGNRYIDDVEYPTLYYIIEDIFNKVSAFSLYKLQAMEEGIDKYAITESERDFFNVVVKRAARDVFKPFSILSKDLTNALQFREVDVSSTSFNEALSVVYVYEKPTYWDDNLTEVFDQKVEETLISYILKEWFKLKNLRDVYTFEQTNYDDLIKELRSLVNHRTQAPKLKYRSF